MLYELREYAAAPGALGRLMNRFEEHVLALFVRHDMSIAGIWRERDAERVWYLLCFTDEQARDLAWVEFSADPQWQAVKRESEQAGTLVAEQRSRFLVPIAATTRSQHRFGEDDT